MIDALIILQVGATTLRLTKTGNSVYNDEIRAFLAQHVNSYFENPEYSKMDQTQPYLDQFLLWLKSSELNSIKGLESFHFRDACLGVTQALDQFHYELLQQNRQLRVFRGEYPYNLDVHPFDHSRDYIEDRELTVDDGLVISCPFSASGGVHPQFVDTLNKAAELEIPVFLDLAWFGTCGGLKVDLSHPAITYAAFSLTKGLTCGNYRSGIRFSRKTSDSLPMDRLRLQNEWNHGIHLNTYIGMKLMNEFGPDTQFIKYSKIQKQICNELGVEPSLCVHIATSSEPKWDEYSRDGMINRLNLRDEIKYRYNLARA